MRGVPIVQLKHNFKDPIIIQIRSPSNRKKAKELPKGHIIQLQVILCINVLIVMPLKLSAKIVLLPTPFLAA